MRPIIYNLNSIRTPVTGIGRYAIELLRGGLASDLPLFVVRNGKLIEGQRVVNLLEQLELQPAQNAATKHIANQNWRQRLGRVPFSREIYRRIDGFRFSNVASNQLNSGAIYHDINYTPIANSAKTVCTVYDLSFRRYPETHPSHRVRFLNKYIEKLKLNETNVITISHSIRDELINNCGLAPERVHVTYLAADEQYRPRPDSECKTVLEQYGLRFKQYILCVATLEPRKNLQRVLSAYDGLDATLKAEFPLVITGAKGWKSQELETQIKALQQQGVVIKTGFVPQSDLGILYAGANMFVYPSLYEGFGLPLLEAMLSGCPCITSDSGALAEVSDNYAIQVDPLDVTNLSEQMSHLLQDSELNAHYSRAGQQRAQQFSWANTITSTRKVYDEI